MPTLSRKAVLPLILQALREDAASQDVTSRAVLSEHTRIKTRIITKSTGILAGGQVAVWTFQTLDASLRCTPHVQEGGQLTRGQQILTVEGRARSIFAAERTALNFLGHLSGIAILTHAFVERTRGTRAGIYDTRKTLPGLRLLEKYAVRLGGGENHRSDLSDAILIKTNHLRVLNQDHFAAAIQQAVLKARHVKPKKFVEVEVASFREFEAALGAGPDAILLDNWQPDEIHEAALRRSNKILLEASGGVTLDNVQVFARTGVDRISIGHLTHSAPALDVSLEVI